MTPSRKKLITTSVLLLGVGVVVVAGITLYPSLRERYWIWKLESGTEQLEAAERLGKIGSVRAIPRLIDACVDADALSQSDADWWIDPISSDLFFDPTAGLGARPSPHTAIYINAIRSIRKRAPTPATKVLERCLSDEREIVRAVAASMLFKGTSRAQKYVSRGRLKRPRIIFD